MYVAFYQLYTLCLGQLAVAVDTDCAEAEIYWTDAAAGIIRKARLNGSDSQVVMTGSLLVSLCVCLFFSDKMMVNMSLVGLFQHWIASRHFPSNFLGQ